MSTATTTDSCASCGDPLAYSGRGRRPTRCESCRRTRRSAAQRDRRAHEVSEPTAIISDGHAYGRAIASPRDFWPSDDSELDGPLNLGFGRVRPTKRDPARTSWDTDPHSKARTRWARAEADLVRTETDRQFTRWAARYAREQGLDDVGNLRAFAAFVRSQQDTRQRVRVDPASAPDTVGNIAEFARTLAAEHADRVVAGLADLPPAARPPKPR